MLVVNSKNSELKNIVTLATGGTIAGTGKKVRLPIIQLEI